MDITIFKKSLEIFSNLYHDGLISIDWRNNPINIRSKSKVKSILKEYDFKIDENDFIENAFIIVDVAKAICTNSLEPIKDIDENIIKLVEQFFIKEASLKAAIATEVFSTHNYINTLNYEILTKRNNKNLKEILGYNLLIDLKYKNIDENSPNTLLLELTEEELSQLIHTLQEAEEKIKSIKEM
jgi:hypothetical protein